MYVSGHPGPRLRHKYLQVPCVPIQHSLSLWWSTSGLPLIPRAQICMPTTFPYTESKLRTLASFASLLDSSVRISYGSSQFTLTDASTALF